MKKNNKLIIITAILTLVSITCGCDFLTNKEKVIDLGALNALEIGGFDDQDGGMHLSEYPMWSSSNRNYHHDTSAESEISVVFNGVTYSGEYLDTAIWLPNTYLSHRYKGDKVYFDVNDNTGELSSILFAYEPAETATLDEAKCRKIADGVADDYIVVSDYKVDFCMSEIYDNYVYTYTYYREVSGYKTSDSLTVSVDGNGKVFSFNMKMIGSFKNVGKIIYSEDEAKEAIEKKLDIIYEGTTTRRSYTIDDFVLVKLEDDSYAFLYTISNQFEANNIEYGSIVRLLLKNRAGK